MGYMLLPAVVLALILGLTSIARDQAKSVIPSSGGAQLENAGETFISYRNAVMAYQRANPSFTGSVPASVFVETGAQFSQAFLQTAGNSITAFGTNGRVVTAYVSLPTGAISAATAMTENDASLGLATGANWKSFAPGASDQPLAVAVPNGALVSITQTGK